MKQGPKPVKFLLSPWVVPKPHPHLLKSQSPKHCEWKWLTISHTSKEPTVSSKLGKRSIPAISSHVQSHNEIKMQILWCCQKAQLWWMSPPHHNASIGGPRWRQIWMDGICTRNTLPGKPEKFLHKTICGPVTLCATQPIDPEAEEWCTGAQNIQFNEWFKTTKSKESK